MNMKKICKNRIVFLISILLISSLTSCGKASEKKVNSSEDSKEINIQDTINLSSEDEFMDDSQSYFKPSSHSVAKGENGYYFLENNNQYIMYFDQESQTSIPLCGKADCNHNSSTCNAYLQPGKYIWQKIYYYQGYLYLISYGGGNAYLERVNADGSGRQELGQICPYDSQQPGTIDLVFFDESVYVFDGLYGELNTEYTNVIRKFSLEDKTEENIFEYTGVNVVLQNPKNYGNKLFFLLRTYTYKDGLSNPSSLGLDVYDYTTGKTEQVMDANISDYCIDTKNDTIYYYVEGDGLYQYNFSSKYSSKLYNADEETGRCSISYDGEKIYMDNIDWSIFNKTSFVAEKKDFQKKCIVLDTDGTIVNTIICENASAIFFGDDKFLFAKRLSGLNSMIYIDKKDIVHATDWSPLVTPGMYWQKTK